VVLSNGCAVGRTSGRKATGPSSSTGKLNARLKLVNIGGRGGGGGGERHRQIAGAGKGGGGRTSDFVIFGTTFALTCACVPSPPMFPALHLCLSPSPLFSTRGALFTAVSLSLSFFHSRQGSQRQGGGRQRAC
jgi:hypothetical protein